MNAPLKINVPRTVKKGRKEAGRWARSVTDEVQNPGSDQHTAQPLQTKKTEVSSEVLRELVRLHKRLVPARTSSKRLSKVTTPGSEPHGKVT